MISRTQYLLGKVAEECCEIAQRALKAAQFGLDQTQTGQDQDNYDRLKGEFNDLLGVIDALADENPGRFDGSFTDPELIEVKKVALRKYEGLAFDLGQLGYNPGDPETFLKAAERFRAKWDPNGTKLGTGSV